MRFFLALAICHALPAQTLQLYSEFRRLDAAGAIVPQDQGGKPREILSPAMARNAFHSMRVAVSMPAGQWYTLHVSQNPDDAAKITLYREKNGDLLEPVKLPVQGKSTGAVDVYWVDVWIAASAPVRRVRLEAQLHEGSGWIIAPMEVRVIEATIASPNQSQIELPPVAASSDTTAYGILRQYLCGDSPKITPSPRNSRSLMRRNAQQDIALARSVEANLGKEKTASLIIQSFGGTTAGAFCASGKIVSPYGPEWYLRVRDFLYREASR